MLTPYDEFPVHQAPYTFSHIPSTDYNWDDGYWFGDAATWSGSRDHSWGLYAERPLVAGGIAPPPAPEGQRAAARRTRRRHADEASRAAIRDYLAAEVRAESTLIHPAFADKGPRR